MADDELSVSEAGLAAKGEAARSLANMADTTVSLADDTLRSIGWVLGQTIMPGTAMIGDYLQNVRVRNWTRMEGKTRSILKERGVEPERVRPISARLGVPLIEMATLESDEVLQDMWARLLANAMDPDQSNRLSKAFISTLEQFEPLDAVVFDMLIARGPSDILQPHKWATGEIHGLSSSTIRPGAILDTLHVVLGREVRLTEYEVTVRHLAKLDCILMSGVMPKAITYFGQELALACNSPGSYEDSHQ